jgi:hypothetical protein
MFQPIKLKFLFLNNNKTFENEKKIENFQFNNDESERFCC